MLLPILTSVNLKKADMASRNIVMLGLGLGLTILSNGKGHFRLTYRNDQTGQNGPPSNLVPNIPVGPNRNGPSHLMYQPKFLKSYVDKLSICGSHEKSRETSTREETRVCRGSPYIESLGLPRSQAAVRKNQAMSSLQKERLVFRRKNLITFASCLGLILQRKTLASSLVLSCNARSVR